MLLIGVTFGPFGEIPAEWLTFDEEVVTPTPAAEFGRLASGPRYVDNRRLNLFGKIVEPTFTWRPMRGPRPLSSVFDPSNPARK